MLHIRTFEVLKSQIRIIDVLEFKMQVELRCMVVANGFVENQFLKILHVSDYQAHIRGASSSTGGRQVIDFCSDATSVDKGSRFRFEQVYEVLGVV